MNIIWLLFIFRSLVSQTDLTFVMEVEEQMDLQATIALAAEYADELLVSYLFIVRARSKLPKNMCVKCFIR